MSKSYWIWYPGDFELYHGMKQNFSRVERDDVYGLLVQSFCMVIEA